MSGTPTKRAKKGGHDEEEHENSERWLLTYADMITLLMVLFIVLFAISAVDQRKFDALKSGLSVGFGAPTAALDGSAGSVSDSGGSQPQPFDASAAIVTSPQTQKAKEADAAKAAAAVSKADRARQDVQRKAAEKEIAKLTGVQRQLRKVLIKKNLLNSVRFHIDERGLVVTIVTDKVVFAGDRAELLPAGQAIVDTISPVLRGLPNSIEVDGHTNQLPVATKYYPSAWELSASRASSVVRKLIGDGLAAKRLSAAGFGEERPLYPASDPRSVTMNRRVDVVVLSTLPPDTRGLLATLAPDGDNTTDTTAKSAGNEKE